MQSVERGLKTFAHSTGQNTRMYWTRLSLFSKEKDILVLTFHFKISDPLYKIIFSQNVKLIFIVK